jgi:hypothetical protein
MKLRLNGLVGLFAMLKLVAESGATFLCAKAGTSTALIATQVAYIQARSPRLFKRLAVER